MNDLQHSHEGEPGHTHRGYGPSVPTPGAAARIGGWLGGQRAYDQAHEHPSIRQLRAAGVATRTVRVTEINWLGQERQFEEELPEVSE